MRHHILAIAATLAMGLIMATNASAQQPVQTEISAWLVNGTPENCILERFTALQSIGHDKVGTTPTGQVRYDECPELSARDSWVLWTNQRAAHWLVTLPRLWVIQADGGFTQVDNRLVWESEQGRGICDPGNTFVGDHDELFARNTPPVICIAENSAVLNPPKSEAGADGRRGSRGPAGANGVAGSAGPQGPVGKDGKDGAAGPQGQAGEKGDKGDKGDDFDGASRLVALEARPFVFVGGVVGGNLGSYSGTYKSRSHHLTFVEKPVTVSVELAAGLLTKGDRVRLMFNLQAGLNFGRDSDEEASVGGQFSVNGAVLFHPPFLGKAPWLSFGPRVGFGGDVYDYFSPRVATWGKYPGLGGTGELVVVVDYDHFLLAGTVGVKASGRRPFGGLAIAPYADPVVGVLVAAKW
ncbi:MAG: hypothetical protein AAB886_02395 [Patescibacteria group bacterium]